jgi:integrase
MDLGLCAVAATQTRRRTAKPRWCSHERQHNRAVAVAPDRAAQRQEAEGAGLADDPKGPLFRAIGRGTGLLTRTPLPQRNAYAMVGRRAAAAGIATRLGNHSFRATGITAYLKNGGTLEKAAQMANHASTRTTQLYDRRREELSLDEVERIRV